MTWFWTPDRRNEPELMDAPGLAEVEVEDAYRVLSRVNRQLGNLRTIRAEFLRFLRDEEVRGSREFTTLDVGSGSGDISASIREFSASRFARFVALDRDPIAARAARGQSLDVVRGDALRLPFSDLSIDVVTAVKFAHHFQGPSLGRLLGEIARVARRRVIVLDIRRHWIAYWGFRAWSHLFTANRLVRHDGPLSVLRGFTREELLEATSPIPGYTWEVRGYLGFQVALVGRRVGIEQKTTMNELRIQGQFSS